MRLFLITDKGNAITKPGFGEQAITLCRRMLLECIVVEWDLPNQTKNFVQMNKREQLNEILAYRF
jgi:hypothetical protein